MQTPPPTNRPATASRPRIVLALLISLGLTVFMCMALRGFAFNVNRLLFPGTATPTDYIPAYAPTIAIPTRPVRTPPPFPTIKFSTPASHLVCHAESVCNPTFNGQHMICIYTVQMVCANVPLPAATLPPSSTPTVTLTPSPSVTPSPTATSTPTPTLTPSPLLPEEAVTAAGSLGIMAVCLILLVGVLWWGFRRR